MKVLNLPNLLQSLIQEFQKTYNTFLEENPDMIEDAAVREEMHQRVDDLQDKLCEVIENR